MTQKSQKEASAPVGCSDGFGSEEEIKNAVNITSASRDPRIQGARSAFMKGQSLSAFSRKRLLNAASLPNASGQPDAQNP
tara:strand:- start:389 stop:628 length:240 start_codon:yes stop_codon:yes gene_type:complete